MQEFTFEAVVARHSELFSDNAVSRATEPLKIWQKEAAQPTLPAQEGNQFQELPQNV